MVGNLPLQTYPPNKGVPSLVQILAAISNIVNDCLESVVAHQQRPPPPPPPQTTTSSSVSPASMGISTPPVSTTSPTTAVPAPSSPQGVHLGSPLVAPKEVHSAVAAKVKEFFEQREAALK